jgi:hypothetical protein
MSNKAAASKLDVPTLDSRVFQIKALDDNGDLSKPNLVRMFLVAKYLAMLGIYLL